MNKIIILSISVNIFLAGCATPYVVQEKQVEDQKLSCEGIEEQIEEADNFEKKARKEKGATGTNIAAAIFFWPGMLATYSNVNDAIDAADDRKKHLHKLYTENSCDGAVVTKDDIRGNSLSNRIAELNELHKNGSLSDDEFKAAKMKVLGL